MYWHHRKYNAIVRHDIQFRSDMAERADVIALLKDAVVAAERLEIQLRKSLTDEDVAPKPVAANAVNRFYAQAGSAFWQMCEDAMTADDLTILYLNWCEDIGRYAMRALQDGLQSVSLRGKKLTHAARQQTWLALEIKKIKEEVNINAGCD